MFVRVARSWMIPKTQFEVKDDTEVNLDKIDILCGIGVGGGEKTGEPLESQTFTKSFKQLVTLHQPEILVIEMAYAWEERYNLAQEFINAFKDNYFVEIKNLTIDCVISPQWVNKRTIVLFTRKLFTANFLV